MALERIWLLTIEALDEMDNPVTLRFSSGDYTDSFGNYYDLRIKQPALFTSAAFIGSVLQAGSRSAFGETTLVNIDGGLDYLADYAVDGRMSILSLRDENNIITPIIEGTVQSLSFESSLVSVRLRDPQEILNLPHPNAKYLGNNIPPNGLEGTVDDIKGQSKPQVFGKVRNAEPFLVNTQTNIYQVHDFESYPSVSVSVISVYDKGVLLTLHTAYTTLSDFLLHQPPAGQFNTYNGYFRLHTAPTGQVTCDADSSLFLLGDVFNLIAVQAGYTLSSSDITTFNAFGEVGIYLTQEQSTSSLLDLLAQSVGAYWYFDTPTLIRMKQLVAPSSPTIFIEDYQIVAISREKTGAGNNGIPIYEVKLKADKVETVQTDVAAGAADLFRARVGVQFREAIATSSAVRTRHPLSEELEIETALRTLAAAETQAIRLQTLLGVRRDTLTTTVRLDEITAGAVDIGTVVNLTSYKLGYSMGKNFIVLGYTLDARLSRIELELFG